MKKIIFYKEGSFPCDSESHIVNKINDTGNGVEKVIVCGEFVTEGKTEGYVKKLTSSRIHSFSQIKEPKASSEKRSLFRELEGMETLKHNVLKLYLAYFFNLQKQFFKKLMRLDRYGRNFLLFHGHSLPLRNSLLRFVFLYGDFKFQIVEKLSPKKSFTKFVLDRFQKERPCVVDCCYGWDALSLPPLKKKLAFKLVISIRGKDLCLMEKLSAFSTRLKDHGDIYLVRCEDMKKRLIALGFNQKKIYVNHSGCDLELFPFEPSKPLGTPLRIVSVGRLIPKKGHRTLLEVGRVLKERGVEFSINLLGDGPMEGDLRKLAKDYQIEDCVRFHGYIPNGELAGILKTMDVFALLAHRPSDIPDAEGIPVALMEAMAVGTICVSTYHSGIPELIEDGKTGFLVKEGEVLPIVNLLQNLKNSHSDTRWDEIRRSARKHVEREFNSKVQAQQYVDILLSARSVANMSI